MLNRMVLDEHGRGVHPRVMEAKAFPKLGTIADGGQDRLRGGLDLDP